MVVGLEEGAQNGVALAGMLQADALQMIVKNFFGLARISREIVG